MATGYIFSTSAAGKCQCQYVTADVPSKTDGIPGGCWSENLDDTHIAIYHGGNIRMSFAKTSVYSIDGDVIDHETSDIHDVVLALNDFFPDASSSGGASNFTVLSGTDWDGANRYTTLTGNTALTLTTTRKEGKLYVEQDGTGSHTLSINGQALTISSGAGTDTLIEFTTVNGEHIFSINTAVVAVAIPVPDTTAPTIVSAEAIDANTIVVTFDEDMDTAGTVAGMSFDNGSALTVTGITWNSATEAEYAITEDMEEGDTITYDYDATAGDLQDEAGNDLADDSGSVTNSISLEFHIAFPTGADNAGIVGFARVWQGDDVAAGYGNNALSDQVMAGDGYIQSEYGTLSNDTLSVGLKSANTLGDTTTVGAGIFFTAGALYAIDNGSAVSASHSMAAGEIARVTRTGTAFVLSTSTDGGETFTNRHTYTYTSGATMYIQTNATDYNRIYRPKGYGITTSAFNSDAGFPEFSSPKKLCLLGDSLAADSLGWQSLAHFMLTGAELDAGSEVVSLAASGNTIANQVSAWSAQDAPTIASYDGVLVSIGTNDVVANFNAPATIISALQSAINTIRTDIGVGNKIVIVALPPAKDRWIDLLGATDGATAVATVLTVNEAIAGAGGTPITGTDGAVTLYYDAISTADALDAAYDIFPADGLHYSYEAKMIIAEEAKDVFIAEGF